MERMLWRPILGRGWEAYSCTVERMNSVSMMVGLSIEKEKASVVDGISIEMLKYNDMVANLWSRLFNTSVAFLKCSMFCKNVKCSLNVHKE